MYGFALFFGEGYNGQVVDHLWFVFILGSSVWVWILLRTTGILVSELIACFANIIWN